MAHRLTLLLSTLEDLSVIELKKFRLYLIGGALEGFPRMPRGKLQEDSDATDIANQMTEMYRDEDSLKIALHILREINHHELAARLEGELERTQTNAKGVNWMPPQVITQMDMAAQPEADLLPESHTAVSAPPAASLHSAAGAGGGVEDGARGTAAQMMTDQQDDIRALLYDSTWKQAIAKAREEVNRLDNVTLNIAVTGHVSVGKSSFVNVIRGLNPTDVGAAPIDEPATCKASSFPLVTMPNVNPQPTMPNVYPQHIMPNVIFWDLPGIGARTFKAATYMKDVNYQLYDFFIIVCESRLREIDLRLAFEIKETNKKFYFVHTKADIDVSRGERKGVTMEATLQNIRDTYVEHFRTLGSPPVFIITCHDLTRFDFQELVNSLVRDLLDEKINALVMTRKKKYKTSTWSCIVL